MISEDVYPFIIQAESTLLQLTPLQLTLLQLIETKEQFRECSEQITTLLNESQRLLSLSEYDDARRCATAILLLIEPTISRSTTSLVSDKHSILFHLITKAAHVYNWLFVISYTAAEYVIAVDYARKGMELAERINDTHRIADLTGNIGAIYYALGDYGLAIEYFSKTLALYEEIGEKSKAATEIGNIGVLFYSIGNHQKSLEYQFRCLEQFQEMGEKNYIATTSQNIGDVYTALDEYSTALEYYTGALHFSEENGL